MTKLGSLDSSRNLQTNYAISFLFRLDLILHACAAYIRCDSFGILNFASKPSLYGVRYIYELSHVLSSFNILFRNVA